MSGSSSSTSRHFTLHELAEGVIAAIATNGGYAICNAGLVDLGGLIVVYDTFVTPAAAIDLKQYATDCFGRPPAIVINSHYHNDHIWGNQVFTPEAQILSSVRTRDLITTEGVEEFRWYSAHSAEMFASLRDQSLGVSDDQQQELLLWMGEYGGIVEALPNLKVTLPNITFNHQLVIHGANQTARLITFEGGHTASDTILFLPQTGIVFMSDLLFVRFHPYLSEGDPLLLKQALFDAGRLEASHFVPGHGPVGTRADLNLLIRYIDHCVEIALSMSEIKHQDETAIEELKIPEQFRQWSLSRFYSSNIQSIRRRYNTNDDNQA